MTTPAVEITWPTAGQEALFDTDPFYDRSADPDQPWNLVPGLGDDMASDAEARDWLQPGYFGDELPWSRAS